MITIFFPFPIWIYVFHQKKYITWIKRKKYIYIYMLFLGILHVYKKKQPYIHWGPESELWVKESA